MPKKGKTSTSDEKKKSTKREFKAGIHFPPSIAEKAFKTRCPGKHKSQTVPVYIAAILDYAARETLRQAAVMRVKRNPKAKRTTVLDIQAALQSPDFSLRGFYPANIGGIIIGEEENSEAKED